MTADPSADPEIIPACQEPISIELDKDNFTAGTAVKTSTGWDAGACLTHIENFTIYAKIPFKITCGSGAQFTGYAVRDLGNGDGVGDEGGCGQSRDNTWEAQHVTLEADGTIRGIWFNYDKRRRETIRHLDLNTIARSSEIVNHTFPLLPFSGGDRILSRPALFVHGLGEPFESTWGVEAQECVPNNVTRDISVAPSVKVLQANRQPGRPYSIAIQGQFGFMGTCAENGTDKKWKTEFDDLLTLDISPSFKGGVEPDDWNDLWLAMPPQLSRWTLQGDQLYGAVEAWILEEDLKKDWSGLKWRVFASHPETRRTFDGPNGTATSVVRADLEFQTSILKEGKEYSKHFPIHVGPLGLVSTQAKRAYGSATAPDIISRIQRLKKGKDINSNGLYFFNGYRETSDASSEQPLPWWTNAGDMFPGQPGESWTLYKTLEAVLDKRYGASWKADASLQIDLVAHSQGGITIREIVGARIRKRPLWCRSSKGGS